MGAVVPIEWRIGVSFGGVRFLGGAVGSIGGIGLQRERGGGGIVPLERGTGSGIPPNGCSFFF